MTGSELRAVAVKLFGPEGWSRKLALALGVSRTQVWRWSKDVSPIPGPVVAAIECWLKGGPCKPCESRRTTTT